MCIPNPWTEGTTWDWGCKCNQTCPIHPYVWPSTTTNTPVVTYVPKHRKPGPAQ